MGGWTEKRKLEPGRYIGQDTYLGPRTFGRNRPSELLSRRSRSTARFVSYLELLRSTLAAIASSPAALPLLLLLQALQLEVLPLF